MSRMPMPSESLTPADISWLRLARHSSECETCLGLRRVRSLASSFDMPVEGRCEEQKRLADAHAANVEVERGSARAHAQQAVR